MIKINEGITVQFMTGYYNEHKLMNTSEHLKEKVYKWLRGMRAHNLPISGVFFSSRSALLTKK